MSQLAALLLTLALELAVGAPLVRWLGERVSWGRAATAVVAASLLTHPFAWAANTLWLRPLLPFAERAAVIELAVTLAEALLLALAVPLEWRRALLVALAMNATSFGLGLVIIRALA